MELHNFTTHRYYMWDQIKGMRWARHVDRKVEIRNSWRCYVGMNVWKEVIIWKTMTETGGEYWTDVKRKYVLPFVECESSLPCSQEPPIGPYFYDPVWNYPLIYALVSQVVSFLNFSDRNTGRIYHHSQACYMSHPSHHTSRW